MRQELETATEVRPAPPSVEASAHAGSGAQGDLWRKQGLVRATETERLRARQQASLQRELRAAEKCQALARNGSFALGILWLALFGLIPVQDLMDRSPQDLFTTFVVALMVLPLLAFAHAVGWVRRRWVLRRAHRHGFELTLRPPVLRRWIVVDGPAAPTASLAPGAIAPAEHSSAGDQLENALARDRHQRRQREQVMQQKLDRACRCEHWGRRSCLWAAFASLFFWASLLVAGTGLPAGAGMGVMIVSGLAAMGGLTFGTPTALGAKLRQRWLLKQARAQALEVVRVDESAPPGAGAAAPPR